MPLDGYVHIYYDVMVTLVTEDFDDVIMWPDVAVQQES